MSTPALVSGSRMLRTADWLFEQEQSAHDAVVDRFEAAVSRAEDEVTFNEVLKRLRSVKAGRKVTLMSCMESDPAHFRWLLENMFRDAFADQCNRRARRELSQPRHVDLQDEA